MSDIRRNRRRIKAVTGLLGAVVLFGAGAAFGDQLAEDDLKAGRGAALSSVRTHDIGEIVATSEQEVAARVSLATKIDIETAAESALEQIPGIATSASLESEQGSLVWEVEVLAEDGGWHELTVDAGNGDVLRQRTERDDDEAEDTRQAEAAKISLVDAADSAVQVAPGRASSASLDADFRGERQLNWKVEVQGNENKEHRVYVDAVTGLVLDHRWDTDD